MLRGVYSTATLFFDNFTMNNPRFLALFTILLWSFGAYLTRLIALRSQFLLLALAFFFAFITLLVVNLIQHRGFSFLNRAHLKLGFLLFGPLGYFVYSVSYNQSSRSYNSISETTILNYTWPVFTIIFTDLVFNKKSNRSGTFRAVEATGILLGFASIVILATRGNPASFQVNLPGIFWGLLTGLSYGIFSAYSSTVDEDRQGVFLLTATLASLVFITGFALGEMSMLNALTLKDVAAAFALGGLLDGIGYTTWTRANRLAHQQRVDISSIASLMLVLPFTSLLIVSLLLGESQILQPYFIASLALILISSIICQKTGVIVGWIKP
jgi:drug/metabolite transporter (DMT)-like permease